MNYSLSNMLGRNQQLGKPFDWSILRDGMTPRRGSVAFTRASTGTFIDPSTSYLATAIINSARIESDGLLIESSNTNYCLHSEDFGTSPWATFRILSNSAVVSPTNGTTARRIIPSTASGFHAYTQAIAQNSTGTWCITVYAKPAGYNWLNITSGNTTNTSAVGSWFDLSTGSLGTTVAVNGTLVSREITDAPNGYKKIKVCYTHSVGHTIGNAIQLYIGPTNNTGSFAGDGTSGIDFYGAEIKPTSPDSYIPTVASAETRSADVCTLTIPAGVSSILITYGDNTTATVSVTPGGTYQLPADTKKYKSIIAL